MEKDRKIHPIYHYPIDDYPININEIIKANEAGLAEIKDDNVIGMLYVGLHLYKNDIDKNSKFCADPVLYKFTTDLFAYTGFIPDCYLPNETVVKKLLEAPEIAVTDLDKALLGWLITIARVLTIGIKQQEKNYRDIFHSFIYFLHNAQRYEQKTKRTLVFSGDMNASYIFNILTKPDFSEIESDSIALSDSDVEYLTSVLIYRDELNKLIEEARSYEKEYVIDEQNNSDWELFISCVNHRASEERRVTNLINSDVPVNQKLHEFKKYFEEIDAIPDMFNSSMSLQDLTDKIIKRTELAPNFVWVNAGDDLVHLDNSIISSVSSPYSFNCVLIAYHAFLIEMSTINIEHLVFSLNMFIGKNLGLKTVKQVKKKTVGSIEQNLIDLSDALWNFYETHKANIDLIKYNSIQNEETLSGFSFDGDIYQRVVEKEHKMAVENMNAFEKMDDEWEEFMDGIDNLFENLESEDDFNDDLYNDIHNLEKDFVSHFPHVFDDEKKLIEREIGNRLIVSINAIYILVKVMERMLEQGLIRDEYKHSIIESSKELSRLEGYLVSTTYIPPNVYSYDDYNMNEYRKRKGIDASDIEVKNNELLDFAMYDVARMIIRALHDETTDVDYEKVIERKSQFREEINKFRDSSLKDFIIELVDEECQYLSNTLIANKAITADFETTKKQLCDYIGPSSKRLPARTINALTTAELLFSQYASAENRLTSFDYSGISALYYQAVESMYNELIWKDYAEFLYKKRCGDNYFLNLYRDKKLPVEEEIYLPVGGQFKYWDFEKKRISDHLMMGSFNMLLRTITSTAENPLMGFREHVDGVFGRNIAVDNADEYKSYQKRIDKLYSLLEDAIIRRNAASHGASPINIEECRADRALVLSDVEAIRKGILGIVMLFLSLYKDK